VPLSLELKKCNCWRFISWWSFTV